MRKCGAAFGYLDGDPVLAALERDQGIAWTRDGRAFAEVSIRADNPPQFALIDVRAGVRIGEIVRICHEARRAGFVGGIGIEVAADLAAATIDLLGAGASVVGWRGAPVEERIARARVACDFSRFARDVTIGRMEIDTVSHTIRIDGEEIILSRAAGVILALMATRPHHPFSRDTILSALGAANSAAAGKTVDRYVSFIRKAISAATGGPNYIGTVHGIGYRLTDQEGA